MPYFLKRFAIECCTMAHEEGILVEPIEQNKVLRDLPSCYDICAMRKPGQKLDITRDLAGIPAVMIQIHPSTFLKTFFHPKHFFKSLNLQNKCLRKKIKNTKHKVKSSVWQICKSSVRWNASVRYSWLRRKIQPKSVTLSDIMIKREC